MNVLLLGHLQRDDAATIRDHIEALVHGSRHRVTFHSMLGEAPEGLDFRTFDAVMIHYSLIASHDRYLGPATRFRLRAFRGVKAMFVQDEYRFVNRTVDVMRYLGIDLLFTCVPESEIEKVYPRAGLPDVEKIPVLTGYVPEALRRVPLEPYHARAIDVGYRGRKLPAWYGELGREKWRIAERFEADAPRHGLHTDISYREEDRLYGEDWIRFLTSVKAVLGVESGASVFDFTGEIQQRVEAHEAAHPDTPFETLRELYFPGLDGRIRLNQISPRCFECAALRTLMVLYEGDYSDVLKPWRHYVPLRKDHANMAQVVAAIRDPGQWQAIVDAAHEEVAGHPDCSYDALVACVDEALEARAGVTASTAASDLAEHRVVEPVDPPAAAPEAGAGTARAARVSRLHRLRRRAERRVGMWADRTGLAGRLTRWARTAFRRGVLRPVRGLARTWRSTKPKRRHFRCRLGRARRLLAAAPGQALRQPATWLDAIRELDRLDASARVHTRYRALAGQSPFILVWRPASGELVLMEESHAPPASSEAGWLDLDRFLDALRHAPRARIRTFRIESLRSWGVVDPVLPEERASLHHLVKLAGRKSPTPRFWPAVLDAAKWRGIRVHAPSARTNDAYCPPRSGHGRSHRPRRGRPVSRRAPTIDSDE